MKVGELMEVLGRLEPDADVAVALDFQDEADLGVHEIVQIDKFELDNGDVAVILIVEATPDGEPDDNVTVVPPAANKN
ncbi:MAG: hypothetical protein CL558_02500 [Alphaproteobacteria bacterium]|nr:hypothetical protein [Alphaproteobacteria bacterium]MAS49184.1 hypothetical protein [Alphaproteobacteria bacterium]MAX97214.1 hypothetical protein [Alphaproteobacteria bacterium]MBN52428.1 hypothetical protein [Alphaproteobacteria bacterium]OUT39777.1 MAG: hypothetical protein CBB62_15625 [Micavibrio sp. TMED2]|tara:strand:- start:3141 stop:3374 length:234 start_codon:yes stop_codon:yes gene_type:complete